MIRRAIFLLAATMVFAYADGAQNIRGHITDKESHYPLPGASVVLISDSSDFVGTVSDLDGNFRLENIGPGRQVIKVSFIGYSSKVINNIIVRSGRDVVLEIELEENAQKLKAVEVRASRNEGDALNEMAIISARAFSVEETERYAGSRGDPARMASNFAGVQGADDSRNDIVVRGNSPLGVLYRLEGVDIPNPNHFAISGSQGGPASIINNKVLSNSDFYTGAFPAEFGNSTAAVFDIRMRNGNNEKHEITGQFGFLGTELLAEGPLGKGHKSSYLFNYRYSTLALFGFMGIGIGTSAIPKYQDLSYKINFPMKHNANLAIFGMGGISDIAIKISDKKPEDVEIYGENDRDQYFGTSMGVTGITFTKAFNERSYIRMTLAQSYESQHAFHQYIYYKYDSAGATVLKPDGTFDNDSLVDILDYIFATGKTSFGGFINKKAGKQHVVKAGINADLYETNMQDSVYGFNTTYQWLKRWSYRGSSVLIQPYVQWKYKAGENWTLSAGIHSQYFSLSNSFSPAEPRAAVRWRASQKHELALGVGMHSQMQPFYTYFYRKQDTAGNFHIHNMGMDFSRCAQSIAGWSWYPGKHLMLKTEVYYQYLYNIPVNNYPSSFSLLNMGSGFSRFFPDTLVNTGTGYNYGVELTLVHFFSKGFFGMLTGALYESRYIGSDGIERPTDFDGNYTANVLLSKEFDIKDNTLSLGTKITYAGNRRYGPVDTLASRLATEVVFDDATRNTLQFPDYFRADIKIVYRLNANKTAHEFGLDLVNVTGQKNVLKQTYAPDPSNPAADPVREEYQLGFLPIFYYRIDL